MKLWLLRPVDENATDGPWMVSYNMNEGFVIRADTADEARLFALKEADAEGADAWIDSTLSTCVELTADGEAGVVIADYIAG